MIDIDLGLNGTIIKKGYSSSPFVLIQKNAYLVTYKMATYTFPKIGKIINECISEIPNHHQDTKVWNYVIMPNHIHIVLHITPKSPTEDYQNLKSEHTNLGCLKVANHSEICEDFHHNSRLSVIIGSFKASVTRCVRMNLENIDGRTRSIASLPVTTQNVWQPRFHEHIVKSRSTLDLIMQYIDNNIATWEHDCFNSNE